LASCATGAESVPAADGRATLQAARLAAKLAGRPDALAGVASTDVTDTLADVSFVREGASPSGAAFFHSLSGVAAMGHPVGSGPEVGVGAGDPAWLNVGSDPLVAADADGTAAVFRDPAIALWRAAGDGGFGTTTSLSADPGGDSFRFDPPASNLGSPLLRSG